MLPELEYWLAGDEQFCTLVKHHYKRSVYALRTPQDAKPAVFLKHLHPPSWTAILKNVSSPRVLREYQTGKALAQLGLPVPEPLACAWKAGHSILLTRAVPNAQKGAELWYRVRDIPARRRQYLRGLSRFLSRLLESKVWHTDLHLGNVLAVEQEQVTEFYLVDLDEVRLLDRLSRAQKRTMLELLTVFRQDLSADEVREALRVSFPHEPVSQLDALWQELCHRTVAKTHRRWANRRKELVRNSSICQKLQSPEGTWLLRRGFDVRTAASILRNVRDLSAQTKTLLKESGERRVFRVRLHGTPYVVKEFLHPGRWRRFSADCQSWFQNWRLEMYGIPIVKCLAWCRASNGHGYLISEYISGVPYDRTFAQSKDSPMRQTYLTTCLGALLQQLSLYGIGVQNLQTQHLVVPDLSRYHSPFLRWYPDTLLDKSEVFLVDSDAVRFDACFPTTSLSTPALSLASGRANGTSSG